MDKLLTTREASKILKMSSAWLEKMRWARSGPPYIKLGRNVRYSQAALEKYLVDNSSGGPG